MDYIYIKLKSYKNKVYEITLNNPNSRNALNAKMLEELTLCLQKVSNEKECRVLIITGSGNTFSAGADLEWMKESIELSVEENKIDALKFSKMLKTLDEFFCPTIAMINGHAFGGGLGIISVCDFAIADTEAKFCFSEVRLGLIPAMIGPYILRSIGFFNTKRLFLTGEIFNADLAVSLNLISMAVEKKNFLNEREKIIEKILLAGPKAQLEIKSYLQNIYNNNIDNVLINKAADSIARIRVSDEAQEGIKAFLNKNKPKWQDENS
ncbi:MAG: hypothetical protein CBE14_003260 [Rickettsiales bacterium TMED254]|mgnify:FL=1|nr:hypothetical protein [Rickettsiales bacterium]RPF75884.1 MAG: hypothetical protein CBE14_003260 [Rickettsiales bacterium TMED254]